LKAFLISASSAKIFLFFDATQKELKVVGGLKVALMCIVLMVQSWKYRCELF
jgi:hypothetical protein